MTIESLAGIDHILEPSAGALLRRRIFGHAGFLIGIVIILAILAVALLAPALAPYDPYDQNLAQRLINPVWFDNGSWAHPLGTDQLGRDYLSRLIYGARISLLIGAVAATISGLIGTSLGLAAGYFGGRVDMVVTFIITTRLAMPVVLVALAVVALAGGSLQVVIMVLGLLLWDRFAVVTRSTTMQIRALDYVAAARATGCSTLRIVLSEILPNIMNALIVVATLEMAQAILLEAALSFLGLGVQPPLPSWGNMLQRAQLYVFTAPTLAIYPGLAITLVVLAFNFLGDGLRDALDPRRRR